MSLKISLSELPLPVTGCLFCHDALTIPFRPGSHNMQAARQAVWILDLVVIRDL